MRWLGELETLVRNLSQVINQHYLVTPIYECCSCKKIELLVMDCNCALHSRYRTQVSCMVTTHCIILYLFLRTYLYTLNTGPNAPSLVLGLCSVVVWTGPNRAYGRVIGYDVNFVPPGSSNVTVSKGIREMFHIIGENEVPMAIRGSTEVQVRG